MKTSFLLVWNGMLAVRSSSFSAYLIDNRNSPKLASCDPRACRPNHIIQQARCNSVGVQHVDKLCWSGTAGGQLFFIFLGFAYRQHEFVGSASCVPHLRRPGHTMQTRQNQGHCSTVQDEDKLSWRGTAWGRCCPARTQLFNARTLFGQRRPIFQLTMLSRQRCPIRTV